MARQFLNITYPSPDHPDYKKVIELAKEHNATKSDTGRRLVHRGLEHLGNPHPLFGDTEAEPSVEPTRREDEQKANTHLSSVVEHVSGEQSPQLPSGDKLKPDNEADRSTGSTPASDKKKSPQKDKSDAGWIILGLLGVGFFSWLGYKLIK